MRYPYSWVVMVVDAIALHRATRLITADTITRPLREAIYRFAYRRAGFDERLQLEGDADAVVDADMAEHTAPRLAELVRCRWCASIWLGAGIILARALAPTVWSPLAALLALSSVAVLLAGIEND